MTNIHWFNAILLILLLSGFIAISHNPGMLFNRAPAFDMEEK